MRDWERVHYYFGSIVGIQGTTRIDGSWRSFRTATFRRIGVIDSMNFEFSMDPAKRRRRLGMSLTRLPTLARESLSSLARRVAA